jgi:hypothetical protein
MIILYLYLYFYFPFEHSYSFSCSFATVPLKKCARILQIECRGAVGETAFHVCFLMGTAVHLHLAKRMLKFYPLLLNDIYLSDEYYGENVLHMSCVAEDPSVVKWLLDIGADFNRFTR